MKKSIAFILLSLGLNLFAQSKSDGNKSFNGDEYEVFEIMITPDVWNRFDILENRNGLSHQEFIQNLDPASHHFAINASISDASCYPLGYYAKDFNQIQSVNLRDGNGNFYLKPNGALLFANNKVVICESNDIRRHNDVKLGIQSGPMLVHNGMIHPVFNPQSKNRNYRCGVGVYEKKGQQFLVFAISKAPVRFYDFADLFLTEYNSENALCLESAGIAMKLPFLDSVSDDVQSTICNYLYLKLD